VPANGSVGTLTVSLRYISQVREVLERERFDLLHFHEPLVPFLSPVVLRESRSVNIATFHAYAGFSPAYEFGSRMLSRAIDRLDGRIAVSAAARHFIDRYFPGDYKVIPNGVDVTRFERAVPIARWHDGTPNLLFVGRHEPRKGLLELLKAFRILRRSGYDCRLLIVGSGPQEREARRYVATRRLNDVEFLGRVSDDEKAQLYRTADVYVSPATGRESFGIVLLEAMASGTAIVCSDIHGYKGVVRRGEQGLLVPPRDPAALATALARLLADEDRRRMGASGAASRRRVQLGAGDGQGRRLLRVRHRRLAAAGPPAHFRRQCRRRRGRPGTPAGAVGPPSIRQASLARAEPPSGARLPATGRPASGGATRRRHPSPAIPLGESQPPHPGAVGEHEAGQGQRPEQDRRHRGKQRRHRARGLGVTANWNGYR
jgi:phosphatidylinositol alpha-mannosyltransferase